MKKIITFFRKFIKFIEIISTSDIFDEIEDLRENISELSEIVSNIYIEIDNLEPLEDHRGQKNKIKG